MTTWWTLQDRLAEIINMLLDRHPMGLRVLLGEAEPPSSEDIHLMYAAGRSSENLGIRSEEVNPTTRAEQIVMDAERFEGVVARAGGWPHIIAIAREWSENYPSAWKIVVDHVRWVGVAEFSRVDTSQLDRVAARHGVHRDTVWRRRRDFPKLLADSILKAPQADV